MVFRNKCFLQYLLNYIDKAVRLREKHTLVGDELKDQNSKLNILQNKEAALEKSV